MPTSKPSEAGSGTVAAGVKVTPSVGGVMSVGANRKVSTLLNCVFSSSPSP